MKYIDIHAHLDFPDFDNDRKEIIADMKSKDIGCFNIGTCTQTSQNSINLAQQNEHIWAIVGVHPLYVHEAQIEELNTIESLLLNNKCVGIGECGMDLFRLVDDQEGKMRQIIFFEKQIELAIKYNKPLMIHCREAYPETLDILQSYKKISPNLHAHFHFFTETIDVARNVLKNNFTLSFTGPITFADYSDVINFVPIDSLMVESDSPYASPKSVRGKRNNPQNIVEIASKIAEIKNLSEDKCAQIIRNNVKRVFGV
jgi:TatD DNase family protein